MKKTIKNFMISAFVTGLIVAGHALPVLASASGSSYP